MLDARRPRVENFYLGIKITFLLPLIQTWVVAPSGILWVLTNLQNMQKVIMCRTEY